MAVPSATNPSSRNSAICSSPSGKISPPSRKKENRGMRSWLPSRARLLIPNGAVVPLTPTFSLDWFMRAFDDARQRENRIIHSRSGDMGFVKTKDGVEIYYKDWGKGQPIVFSHGWPLSADDWDNQMLFFLNHGYRVIAHDRRGHGRSSQVGDGHDIAPKHPR